MTDYEITKLPIRPSTGKPALKPNPGGSVVIPFKKPEPKKAETPATPVKTPPAPRKVAQRLDFPVYRTRVPHALPRKLRFDNVVSVLNTFWLEAFMRKVGLNLAPHQLMITQEKRLLLVDYSGA